MAILKRPGLAVGLTVMLAGAAIFAGATRITSGFGYDAVGPAAFPKIIGIGMLISGSLILLEPRADLADATEGGLGRIMPVAVISAAILLLAFGVTTLGWVPMAALVFLAGAYAFGDHRILTNALIGLIVGGITLGLFNWGLGLNLPLGVLSPLLGADR